MNQVNTFRVALAEDRSCSMFHECFCAVLTPLSLVASLDPDRLYIFNCIANGSGVPTAEIDGLLFNHQTILAKGITVTLVSDENVLHNSTVRIPATIENNDTSIQCLFFGDSGRQESAIGTFFVQGISSVATYGY